MSVVLCILFAVLGAALGAVLSQDLDDEAGGWKRAPAARGGVVGAAWGGLAGLHLGRIISFGDVIEALSLILWPILILAALASLGFLARLLTRPATSEPGSGAIANWLGTAAAILGFIVIIIFFVSVAIVLPDAAPSPGPSFKDLPRAVQTEVGFRIGLTVAGALAGLTLLMLALWGEFAIMMIGASLGQFAGGLAGALIFGHGSFSSAVPSGLAAAAGGLCTSFEWGLAGAIFAASIGSLFLIVWLLIPGIGEASDALPDKDEYSSDLVEMRGVQFAKALGGFGKLADEDGPFRVIAGLMAAFAFLGCLCGFLIGPVFGDGILRSLELVR